MDSNRSTAVVACPRGLIWVLAACALGACSRTSAPASSNSRSAPLASPDVYLQAQVLEIPAGTFDNPEPISMWGFAKCTAGFASCDPPTVPGPELTATEGTSLTVHVRNGLVGAYVEPVSVIIPGQLASMTPVWIDPATGTVTGQGARPAGDYHSRVRSFTAETAPGGTTEQIYTWPNLKAGTFLYQSGTHPAVQVQMGLYGALRVYPATAGQAYDDPGSAYDAETTLVYSEIDPVLHHAIATGTYGPNPNAPDPAPAGWMTSTIDYKPRYFLINGRPFTATATALSGGVVGKRWLLRLLNAGLQSKVPTLSTGIWSQIAEDGNFITVTTAAGAQKAAPRGGYAVLLPPGKTVDVIVTPKSAGQFALFDRRMSLSNAGTVPGGMLTHLTVASVAAPASPSVQPTAMRSAP